MEKLARKLITIIAVLVLTLEASGDGGKNFTINIIKRLEFSVYDYIITSL